MICLISFGSFLKTEKDTVINNEFNPDLKSLYVNNGLQDLNHKLNFSNPKSQKKDNNLLTITKANSSSEEINLDKSADFNNFFKLINPCTASSDEKTDNTNKLQIKKTKGFFYDFISGKKMINLNQYSGNNKDLNKNNNTKNLNNAISHTKYKLKNVNYNLNFSSRTDLK